MEEKRLLNLIMGGLKKRAAGIKVERSGSCPGETELNDYLHGLLSKEREKALRGHVKDCWWCIEQLDQAQRAWALFGGAYVRKPSIRAYAAKIIGWVRQNAWLLAASVAFILSFMVRRYFFQLLILTLLLCIKWIFTTGGAKTVIMIYEALKKKEGDGERGRFSDRDRLHLNQ